MSLRLTTRGAIADLGALGALVAVHGSVTDIRFESASLPQINEAVAVLWDGGAPLIVEGRSLLSETTVRGVAIRDTSGLARGTQAVAAGSPIMVPVGTTLLDRIATEVNASGAISAGDLERLATAVAQLAKTLDAT